MANIKQFKNEHHQENLEKAHREYKKVEDGKVQAYKEGKISVDDDIEIKEILDYIQYVAKEAKNRNSELALIMSEISDVYFKVTSNAHMINNKAIYESIMHPDFLLILGTLWTMNIISHNNPTVKSSIDKLFNINNDISVYNSVDKIIEACGFETENEFTSKSYNISIDYLADSINKMTIPEGEDISEDDISDIDVNDEFTFEGDSDFSFDDNESTEEDKDIIGEIGGEEDNEEYTFDDFDDAISEDSQAKISESITEEEQRSISEIDVDTLDDEIDLFADDDDQSNISKSEEDEYNSRIEAEKEKAIQSIQNDEATNKKVEELTKQIESIVIPEIDSSLTKEEQEKLEKEKEEKENELAKLQEELNNIINKRNSQLDSVAENIERKIQTEENKKVQEKLSKLAFPNVPEDMQDEVKQEVTSIINEILAIYDKLYSELYKDIPRGIVTPYGIATAGKDGRLVYVDRLKGQQLFLIINELSGKRWKAQSQDDENLVSSKWINVNNNGVQLAQNFAYRLQTRNLFGVIESPNGLKISKNWGFYRNNLLKSLQDYITDIISKVELKNNFNILSDLRIALMTLFTNTIVAKSFNQEGIISIRVKSTIGYDFGPTYEKNKELFTDKIMHQLGRTSGYSLLGVEDIGFGIYDITIAANEDKYKSEVFFSYKILNNLIESGNSVDYEHTILGKTPSDKIVTYNFKAPGAIDSLILAGSRSGKGVLTLNILATLLGSGCPVVYFDYKPDMSKMLWDFERELQGMGYTNTKILSIDAAKGTADQGPIRGGKIYFSKPASENIKNLNNLLLIPWIKGIILMSIAAFCRANKVAGLTNKGGKMITILDEAQNFNKSLSSLKSELDKIKKDHKPVRDPKTKEKVADEIYTYSSRLLEIIDSMFPALTDFRNTSGGSGNAGVIMLGQQADATAWSQGALKRDALGFMVGNCSLKILGKEAVGSTKYEMNGVKSSGKDALPGLSLVEAGTMGYFVKVESSSATRSNSTVFKSSLVLNKNDYDPTSGVLGTFTGDMIKNVAEEIKQDIIDNDFTKIDETTGQKVARAEVGFPGLLQYIGSVIPGFNPSEALSMGYRTFENILLEIGVLGQGNPFGYTCVEDYLFDASVESFIRFDEIKTLLNNNRKIDSLLNKNDESDKDEYGSIESEDDSTFGGAFTDDIPEGIEEKIGGTLTSEPQISEGLNRSVESVIKNPQKQQIPTEIIGKQYVDPSKGNLSDEEKEIIQGIYEGNNKQKPIEVESDGYSIFDSEDETDKIEDTPNPIPEYAPHAQETIHQNIDGTITFMSSTPTIKRLKLEPKNCVLVRDISRNNSGMAKTLFRSLRGAKYELSYRWKLILSEVAKKQNKNTITRVSIMEDLLLFNERMVACEGILGGPEGVEVADIVDYKELSKRFPMIKVLTLSATISNRTIYNMDNPVEYLFNTFRNLLELRIVDGDKAVVVNRKQINDSKTQRKIMEAKQRNQLRNQIDAVSAANNPRKKNTTGMEAYRDMKLTECLDGKLRYAVERNISKQTFGGSMVAIGASLILAVSSPFRFIMNRNK